MRAYRHLPLVGVATFAVWLADIPEAKACGCLSPPAVTEGQYSVNQSAEQIIFEHEPGWVTAHVLIKYAGEPAKFAWIVPVPEVPELGISPVTAFGLLDRMTAPDVFVSLQNVCPISEWSCQYHEDVYCEGDGDYGFGGATADGGLFGGDAGASGVPGVTVINEQVVGDYQTVTFRASEAASAVQWLRDNGFIVNQTTSIYMESYVQANMVFVAAKLVPGAGIRSIKPLRMKYRAAFPTVPLILTAVAAEPHLTINTFIYGNKPFRPQGQPIVTIDETRIAQDDTGRTNYPMVLARTVDEAGGNGFAVEYRGPPQKPAFDQNGMCCEWGYDVCNVGNNNSCECPRDEYDFDDCSKQGDLVEGVALLDQLAQKYSTVTRITTRVSAEEMNFDPAFEADYTAPLDGKLLLSGKQPTLAACGSAVIDKARYAELEASQMCASTYCGSGGQCVATPAGAACACDVGFVAQRFVDVDSKPSVTCVPTVPPVDLRAGGLVLPDACAGVSCGSAGRCIDRNGVPVCACNPGTAAALGTVAPRCEAISVHTHTPGGQDFSDALADLDVCAPEAPVCGAGGWLVKTGSPRPGVNCGLSTPSAARQQIPPKPTCGYFFGCSGCSGAPTSAPIGAFVATGFVTFFMFRRRRARRVA